ncbi:MAG TPA: hypothetical protein VF530_17400 [Planctomycetota bacterium]
MSATYETTVNVEAPARVLERLPLDIRDRQPGWRLVRHAPRTSLEYSLPVGLRSWGESIEITVAGGSLRIVSRCRFPIIDWGRNARNVEVVRACIQRAREQLSTTG